MVSSPPSNFSVLAVNVGKSFQTLLPLFESFSDKYSLLVLQITWILAKHNPKFLALNMPLVNKLHEIWITPEFHQRHEKGMCWFQN